MNEKELKEVNKINTYLVKEAVYRIKPKKSDPFYEFSSDFIKNAPDLLFDIFAILFQSFLIHAHIPSELLVATIIPIVKDKLADVNSSSNYRSLAISSQVLKILDWIILISYGHLLESDSFQFGFQAKSNTSLCSWMVLETVDKYLREGSTVFGCLIDCSKAFDTVLHSKIFEKLLQASIPLIVVRLYIHIYRLQTAKVKWKENYSSEFKISNGPTFCQQLNSRT